MTRRRVRVVATRPWLVGLVVALTLLAAGYRASSSHAAAAQEPSTPRSVSDRLLREGNSLERAGDLQSALSRYEGHVEAAPADWRGLMLRGSARFRLGDVAGSVADFESVVLLDPDQEPYLWQLGIAQYYAGQFEKCAQQFVVHRTVNPNDVENAAWHYLCVAAWKDTKTALAELLPVGADPRAPMREIYEMFAGRATPERVLEAGRAAQARQGPSAPFYYAHLYVGLWHEAHGRELESAGAIATAAELAGEPPRGYMGDVAVVHQMVRER